MRTKKSDYMEWTKTHPVVEFNLRNSGIISYPMKELKARIEDLEITGTGNYGYAPLQEALAKKCGATADCVVAATGTSMANHLVMAALLDPEDEVLIERPTYEPILAIAKYLGVKINRFDRTLENKFQIDPFEVARNITSRTRLIVLTNLHNPTGVLTNNSILKKVGELANECAACVLVDEVYLEAFYPADGSKDSAFHLGKQFVTTSSLTKAYGLSGLRCGWILAEDELAKKMWRLNDLFGVTAAHSAERLSVIALKKLDQIANRAKRILEANRSLLTKFFDETAELDVVMPDFGTIAFPRLKQSNADAFCELLRKQYQTAVVPGRFFEMPPHFRIGIGCSTEVLSGGLQRMAKALQAL